MERDRVTKEKGIEGGSSLSRLFGGREIAGLLKIMHMGTTLIKKKILYLQWEWVRLCNGKGDLTVLDSVD